MSPQDDYVSCFETLLIEWQWFSSSLPDGMHTCEWMQRGGQSSLCPYSATLRRPGIVGEPRGPKPCNESRGASRELFAVHGTIYMLRKLPPTSQIDNLPASEMALHHSHRLVPWQTLEEHNRGINVGNISCHFLREELGNINSGMLSKT